MPLAYAVKHVFRSWKLFLALLIGIILASTFFAGIDIKANVTAKQALDQQLSNIPVDIRASISTSDPAKMLEAKERALSIEGVEEVEIMSSAPRTPVEVSGEQEEARIIGITKNSHVYNGWSNRPDEIEENETYIVASSPFADKYAHESFIEINFSIRTPFDFYLNLTVKGLAKLDDKAYSLVSGYTWMATTVGIIDFPMVGETFLLVSWEKTARMILDEAKKVTEVGGFIATRILIYLDRDALITPWDIDSSINNIKTIEYEIQNKLAALGIGFVQNNLENSLSLFRFTSIMIRFTFTVVSLPIFFMAWYMGTTVSNVSFNLRRREIGLLSTKGFSRGQIQRMFLAETVLIGLIGSVLGVFLGFLLNPLFTQFSSDALFNPKIISPYTMIFTIAFGIVIALLSTFSSAKKASQLPTIDALREYLPLEEIKPYRKRWPWVAFILGTYKIIVFILGTDMTAQLNRIMFTGGNFILILLVGIFMFIDMALNYIGPLLFFWGFTKLFIQGSLKFQEFTAKASKFLGDLGVLATKNVRRNPARSAAMAFLLALIIGYSVQVTGQLASEEDYVIRQIYYEVGADVSLNVVYANEASDILDAVVANISDYIENATIEYSFSASFPAGTGVRMKAVEPHSWLKAAYYEGGWFSRNDVSTAFNDLAADKDTIILERSVAKLLNLELGEDITLIFGSLTKTLEVVGFFGPEPSQQQQPISTWSIGCWSFISHELYEDLQIHVSAYAKILVKLKSDSNAKDVAEIIRKLEDLNIGSVESFIEEWEEAQADVITMGMLDVQRLGIIFAVLAASAGTALVSTVSMKERNREATIMSVKGLSYKQLVTMFLTENLALVLFSITLGLVVGSIAVYGNISAANASVPSLVQRRLVFPLETLLMLFSCIALIFISTILPILIMSRKYVMKLERMVRLR